MITRIRIEVSERIADEAARHIGIRARKRALKQYCAMILSEALRALDRPGGQERDGDEHVNVR